MQVSVLQFTYLNNPGVWITVGSLGICPFGNKAVHCKGRSVD